MKWFSLIYQGDIHPSTDEKVVSQEDYSQLLTASEIIEKAKEDAAKLKKKTKAECEKLKEQAKEEGHQEGLERLSEQLLLLDTQLKTLRQNLQKMVLPIALKAAKRIVGKELDTFPETIVDIVMQVIAPISQSHEVIIFVNKEDKELIDKDRPRIKEILDHVEILKIEERADIARGDCLVKTEKGMINATLKNQFDALERAFDIYRPSS